MNDEKYQDMEILFSEEPVLPHSLSKENMTQKLKGVKQKSAPKSAKKVFLQLTAVAAAVAVVAVGTFSLGNIKRNVNINPIPQTQTDENGKKTYEAMDLGLKKTELSQFESDEDIKNHVVNLAKENSRDALYDDIFNGFGIVGYGSDKSAEVAVDTDITVPVIAENQEMAASKDSATEESFDAAGDSSQTNTQTQGVDEADLIKNDGRYLYIVSHRTEKLSIVDTETMTVCSVLEIEAQKKGRSFIAENIYLNGNTLVVIGSEYEEGTYNEYVCYEGVYGWRAAVQAASAVYDISDKTQPKLVRYVTQDGFPENSRMIGTVLYTVTGYCVDISDKDKAKEKYAPAVNGEMLGCDCIYVSDADSTNYIVLSAFDTADAESEVNSVSVLGNVRNIYCSQTTLYVSSDKYSVSDENGIGGVSTDIIAFSLDSTNVALKATGVVPGTVDDQYSFDEYGGFLRVAATDYDYNQDEDISSLYVLDSNLDVIGKAYDIAPDEQIKSVRFMEDTAYVVTFKNTDPLFVIDLSDPSDPKITGEVKLPGFSEYLHPVGDGLLVGIGYCGDEESANYDSVKISLFDVSDPAAPKELDSHVIEMAYTEVNYNPKAFVYNAKTATLYLPLLYYSRSGDDDSWQYKAIRIENGKFTDKQNYAHPTQEEYGDLFRGAYIADKLYTVTDYSVAQFDLESARLLKTVSIR